MCWLPYIADMIRSALEFVAGVLAAQQIHSPSPSHKTRAGRLVRESVGARPR
jgi:hypothetical protein